MSFVDEVASLKTLRLTTVGRKSGQERTAEVWFVVDDGAIWVQAGAKGVKGWYANVRADPRVRLAFGERKRSGLADCATDDVERQRVVGLFRRKYLLARLASWLGSGIGQGRPVRIQITEE